MKSCPMHSSEKDQDTQPSKGCCDDQADYLSADVDQVLPGVVTAPDLEPSFVGVLFVLFNLDFQSSSSSVLHYLNYKPPLIVCDFTISLQTFLC